MSNALTDALLAKLQELHPTPPAPPEPKPESTTVTVDGDHADSLKEAQHAAALEKIVEAFKTDFESIPYDNYTDKYNDKYTYWKKNSYMNDKDFFTEKYEYKPPANKLWSADDL